jgi:two-component system cell cycle sensor histidine kinase/response regulator CckA
VGLLAAGLAHDLNNMLGGIVSTAELLAMRGTGTPEDRRDVEAIVDQAVRASRLIRQILAFSRQELLKPQRTDIGQLALGFVPMLSALAGANIRLDLALGAPAMVRIDPTALERVVVNLVLNAREALAQAMPGEVAGALLRQGGRIRLSTGRLAPGQVPAAARSFMPDGAYGLLSVEDDGPGIPEVHAARIFEPYFTTRANGQGLGLATAYGLVKQSGGFLLHDRGPWGGARFSIYLPEAPPEASDRLPPRLPSGRVILLAEDELLLRMSAARGLERLGYRVRQAADGEAALARLDEGRPDLIISDIRMPGLDGLELARRARQRHPGLPVLLVTGFADEAARAALPGADVGVLEKPFTLKMLGERVHALI